LLLRKYSYFNKKYQKENWLEQIPSNLLTEIPNLQWFESEEMRIKKNMVVSGVFGILVLLKKYKGILVVGIG